MMVSPAQKRALEYLFNHELRLLRIGNTLDHWLGEGTFRVARVTVAKLVNRNLASVVTEPHVKRCRITERGKRCVRGGGP